MILVFGRTGQVGAELVKLMPDAKFLARSDADLGDPAACALAVLANNPTAVIIAAAYTAVDAAETDEENAYIVNGLAPASIAQACTKLGIPVVHISTDYVFAGDGQVPFAPQMEKNPINAYGRSKRAGEVAIENSGAVYGILRTSWVFSAHGQNFVKTMLRLSQAHAELRVVSDQIGGPTAASDIAAACVKIANALITDATKSGTYHLSGAPDTSWAAFARQIFRVAGKSTKVTDIATADYPTAARRPLNSRLDCTSLDTFGIQKPDWRQALATIVKELE